MEKIPAEIYDINAIRVDRSALTIRDAATVLNRELTGFQQFRLTVEH